jgi:O-antigen/teichoic acid export membrane protein
MLFTLFLGQQWREAGYYARVLSPVYYLCFIHYCLDSTLNVLELQHWQVAWDSSRLVAVVLTLVIMGHMHAGPIVLLGIFAIVSATAYAMHIALCYRAVCRLQTIGSTANGFDVTPRVESMPEPVSR